VSQNFRIKGGAEDVRYLSSIDASLEVQLPIVSSIRGHDLISSVGLVKAKTTSCGGKDCAEIQNFDNVGLDHL